MKKSKIHWKKIENYKKSVFAEVKGRKILPACILCETTNNINVRALWVDDERKRAVFYFLCKDCADELFFELSDADRESIVAKVIEKKIDAFVSLPHPKLSQLLKSGFEIVF